MRFFLFSALFFFVFTVSKAQNDISLEYYLPKDIAYNPEIPKPQDIIGYVPGKWHVSHDQLISYMAKLAEVSPRITLENRGKTFEDRPIYLLKITSVENHQNLENIRTQHLKNVNGETSSSDIAQMPIVVYQGFSIHGNEPSGSNAALIAAYYLAAAQGAKIDELLKNTVILFDPSYNPDGLQRFSYWANTNKSKNLITDSQDREYREVWPGGRTNHYWFDMNRDWLPVQLPESKARIKTFHQWYPNILTDHHEMGTNSTFFFQPGIPSRTHPLTPELNQKLTKKIATYHAKALDKIGSFYYTEENFDDFYYGKGSTFPDVNGGVGILFEQGSSRGHAQESDNGILTFPFTIRNQFTATLSTLEAAVNLREELLTYQRNFYIDALQEAEKDYYIFGSKKDATSAFHLAEILKRHQIDLYQLDKNFEKNNNIYTKEYAYAVPKNQRQNRLIKAIFEKRTTFKDSLFYDISAWTFPLAFNLNYTEASNPPLGEKITDLKPRLPKTFSKSNYAYLIEWHEYYTPAFLYKILEQNLRAKVAMKPFELDDRKFDYGTLLIPIQNQALDAEEIFNVLQNLSKEYGIDVYRADTGLSKGINLGSSKFRSIKLPKIGLFTGEGITSYDAGEIWHLMDQRYNIPITKLDLKDAQRMDLSKYTHLILPNSRGKLFDKNQLDRLKSWIKEGGTLIGYRNAANFFKNEKFMDIEFAETEQKAKNISFEEVSDFNGAQVIGGAIFEAKIDRSHPINFGYSNKTLPLFRNTTLFIKPEEDSYKNPIQYTKKPLLSGYVSKKNLDSLSGTVPFKHSDLGRGNVILFTDNTNFRAFWYGTNKLLMNAIFFDDQM